MEVAAQLLREHGPSGVTTRAVAQAAGMQAPAIYRLFGDKDGLLDAVAEHVLAAYVDGKEPGNGGDPVADLRAGWDTHRLRPGQPRRLRPSRSPLPPHTLTGGHRRPGRPSRVHHVAAASRLRVPERRAVELIHAAGTGAVLTLLSMPPQDRDTGLADAMFDAAARSILTELPAVAENSTAAATFAFRAVVPDLPTLTTAERFLLSEWLDRPTPTT
ncbi:helix-turn-helix domain-containing protein [Streptomyces crystallinus]|uniref:TetR/AcrR family transcriptional regulator n=1 Tax=Streptomyces crystallinus TaxID=68191 RepID=A0ABN1GSA0_9ACTN